MALTPVAVSEGKVAAYNTVNGAARTDLRYSDTGGQYSDYRIGEPTAAAKILIDRAADTIVGVHVLGPGYGELIDFAALAVGLGLTTRQLESMATAYPSIGSDLGSML